jgi:glucose-1-phosphate thymidylyltransferase
VGQGRRRRVVGVVPAAGQATRIAPLPVSKELLPVGLRAEGDRARIRVACHCLLERMRYAGVDRAFLLVGHGKWDIPAYLGDGADDGMDLAYVVVRDSRGAAFTVDRAFPFVADDVVAFGFPDIQFRPADAFDRLLSRQAEQGADVVLGLFPTDRPDLVDMVGTDDRGAVRRIVVKPAHTTLRHTWIIAVWTPAFTAFLHRYANERMVDRGRAPDGGEVHVGHVIQAAVDAGMSVDSVVLDDGSFLDIGNAAGLAATLPFVDEAGGTR